MRRRTTTTLATQLAATATSFSVDVDVVVVVIVVVVVAAFFLRFWLFSLMYLPDTNGEKLIACCVFNQNDA